MKNSKLIIESDGEYTSISIGGVLLGPGIGKLEFSTEDKNGEMRPTISLMEISVGGFDVKKDDRTCGNKCGHEKVRLNLDGKAIAEGTFRKAERDT